MLKAHIVLLLHYIFLITLQMAGCIWVKEVHQIFQGAVSKSLSWRHLKQKKKKKKTLTINNRLWRAGLKLGC